MKNKTKNQNYTATILVDSAQQDVYKAINNVRGWWSENIGEKPTNSMLYGDINTRMSISAK